MLSVIRSIVRESLTLLPSLLGMVLLYVFAHWLLSSLHLPSSPLIIGILLGAIGAYSSLSVLAIFTDTIRRRNAYLLFGGAWILFGGLFTVVGILIDGIFQ